MLAGLEAEELREVGKRLLRSHEGLEFALGDLKAERDELEEEKAHLNATIELVMQDLRKLNIGAATIPEPKLDESPVQFIGRLWERVKPRDTAYSVSEHVSEIKKPSYSPDGSPSLGNQVAQHSQELRRQFSDHFSMFKSAVGQVAETVTPRDDGTSEDASSRTPASMKLLISYLANPGGMPEVGPDSSGPGAEDDVAPPTCADADAGKIGATESRASTGANSEASSKTASRESRGVSREASEEVADDAPRVEAASSDCTQEIIANTSLEPIPEPCIVEVEAPKEQSSLLIEVQLTLGDGSVAACKVYASDRCKEVAARFVQENSLKAPFEAPLKAYLMEVEANAVKFPVELEADIMEIRNQYSNK